MDERVSAALSIKVHPHREHHLPGLFEINSLLSPYKHCPTLLLLVGCGRTSALICTFNFWPYSIPYLHVSIGIGQSYLVNLGQLCF
jgi:hypothetical protein